MRLIFHEGKNFGDALNPLVFKGLLPGFFDNDSSIEFLGIGSVLGLKRPSEVAEKFIVFSSGIGGGDVNSYGQLPTGIILEKYDVVCVRGPKTAEAMGLSIEKAICDGAILLSEVYTPKSTEKKFPFAYIPHHGSLKLFSGWTGLMADIGVHLIDPTKNIHTVLDEISQSEIVIAEAMHGAIVADTLRVPWIPVRTKKTINAFKWQDFTRSVDLPYNPHNVKTLFDYDVLLEIAKGKTKIRGDFPNKVVASAYATYQGSIVECIVKKQFEAIKLERQYLSKGDVLRSRQDQLLNLLFQVKERYTSA